MTEWVLVPREPTAKMVLAAFDAITNASGEGMIRARWRCMLDAAPAAPQQAEPVAWMAFGGALVHAVTRNAMDPIEAERFDVPLYLHPPAAPQQAEPALNERVGLAYKNGYEEALNDCIRNGGEAWARSMFANGGEHIKPQQAEPVAHLWQCLGLWSVDLVTGGTKAELAPPQYLLDAVAAAIRHPVGKVHSPMGPRTPDPTMVICPACTSQFTATPESVQAEVQRLKQERDGLKNRLESRHDGGPDGISARDETIKMQDAEVRRLQEALEPFTAIDLTTNQAVDAMDVLRARRALEGGA